MKKAAIMLVTLLYSVVFGITACAEDNGFIYAVKVDGTAIITGYYGDLYGELAIPSTIDGYKVTEIGADSFSCEKGISKLNLPESVKKIGTNAFNGCSGLEEIYFSEGLSEIGEQAFANCSYLHSVALPDSLTDLESWAFFNCYAIESAVVGNSLEVIPAYAFEKCYALKEVSLGENVRLIEQYAFAKSGIERIFIPLSLEEVEAYAFYECRSIKLIDYEGSYEDWLDIEIGECNSEFTTAYKNELAHPVQPMEKKNSDLLWILICVIFAIILITETIYVVTRRKPDVCRYCNTKAEEGAKFCGNCGAKL